MAAQKKKKTTAKKTTATADARKGQARFIDQPGQWVSKTPASVKKRQTKEWAGLAASLKKGNKK